VTLYNFVWFTNCRYIAILVKFEHKTTNTIHTDRRIYNKSPSTRQAQK